MVCKHATMIRPRNIFVMVFYIKHTSFKNNNIVDICMIVNTSRSIKDSSRLTKRKCNAITILGLVTKNG